MFRVLSEMGWPEFEGEPEADPLRGIIRGVIIGMFCFWLPLALVFIAVSGWRPW